MINLLVYNNPKMHNETRQGLWKQVRKSNPAIKTHIPSFKSFLDNSARIMLKNFYMQSAEFLRICGGNLCLFTFVSISINQDLDFLFKLYSPYKAKWQIPMLILKAPTINVVL